MMKPRAQQSAVTLLEVMFSVAATSILMGALVLSSISIQKSIRASETFGTRYSDQRRIIDYIAREMRRATGVQVSNSGGALTALGTDATQVSESTRLMFSVPGYYKSNDSTNANYTDALPVVQTAGRVDYGDGSTAAPVSISFRKSFIASEGGICFVREEAGAKTVVVRDAKDLFVEASVTPDGRNGIIRAWFVAPYTQSRTLVATSDEVLLRNAPDQFRP